MVMAEQPRLSFKLSPEPSVEASSTQLLLGLGIWGISPGCRKNILFISHRFSSISCMYAFIYLYSIFNSNFLICAFIIHVFCVLEEF